MMHGQRNIENIEDVSPAEDRLLRPTHGHIYPSIKCLFE